MGVVETLRLWLSPRERLLHRLAGVAGDAETLATRLTRHAQMCRYPTLKAGLKELAAAETEQAKAMRELLLADNMWPKLRDLAQREGSSNWERLQNDLALQVEILRALHSQHSEWTTVDLKIAERLRELALDEDRHIEQLRDLTLRCDPQALD
jgi:bacterioferritin (cytochrome b1)